MKERYAIYDTTNDLLLACCTERDTIFMTKDPANAELFSSLEDASEMKQRIEKSPLILDSVLQREVLNINLQIGTIQFVPLTI